MPQQFSEYPNYDALGLAQLIKDGEVSAKEVLEEAIGRIEKFNPTLNAVNYPLFEQARENVNSIDPNLPFAGVPTLLKDISHHLKDTPLSEGSKLYVNRVSTQDSHVAESFKQQGFVICGKSSTPEFALKGITEPEAFGPTRNPWNTNHSSGGSSGGASSAVAARLVPLASASDGGGSIRIPAGYTGLVGLKPSRARVSAGPQAADLWEGFSSSLVLSRTVRDSAASLDFMAGAKPGDPYSVIDSNRPSESYLADSQKAPKQLKIAYSTHSPLGSEVDPDAVQAVMKTVKLLEAAGHICEEAQPNVDGHQVAESFLTIYYAFMSAKMQKIVKEFGKDKAREMIELDTQVLACIGNAINSGTFIARREDWNIINREMARFLDSSQGNYDLYLIPTAAQKPFAVGEMAMSDFERIAAKVITRFDLGKVLIASGMVKKNAGKALARTPFTQLANLSGLPAISLPVFISEDGFPLGSQLVAPAGDELTLLQVAQQLEEQVKWQDRQPDLIS